MHTHSFNRIAVRSAASARNTVVRAGRSGVKPVDIATVAAPFIIFAAPALADEASPDAVDSIVGAITAGVKASAGLVKVGVSIVSAGVDVAKQGYELAAPVVAKGIDLVTPVLKQGVDSALPVVKQSFDQVSGSVTPYISNSFNSVSSSVSSSLSSVQVDTSGLPLEGISSTITNVGSSASSLISSIDPAVLGGSLLGGGALIVLAPVAASLLNPKGYAGGVPATSVQATLIAEGNVYVIDVRSPKEKARAGVPDLPSTATGKYLEVELVAVEDNMLKASLKSVGKTACALTAVQIATLKKVSKDTKIFLLDSKDNGAAKQVAKALTARGFKQVYNIAGGMQGKNGWLESKLAIKEFAGSAAALSSGTGSSGIFGSSSTGLFGSGGTGLFGSSKIAKTGTLARSGTAKTTSTASTAAGTSTMKAKTSTMKAKSSTVKTKTVSSKTPASSPATSKGSGTSTVSYPTKSKPSSSTVSSKRPPAK